MNGIWYKGMFFPAWCGLYAQMSNNPSFIRGGGLDNISRTIKAEMADAGTVTEETKDMAKIYRIRKLTPRECFRLMGVSDHDIDLIQHYPYVPGDNGEWVLPEGMTDKLAKTLQISESQQYKMAGNSIVVDVLEAIFTQLFRLDADCLF